MKTKSKTYIPAIIALAAVMAVATSPSIFAEPGMDKARHYDLPDLAFTDGSITAGDSIADALDSPIISITDAVSSIGDRQVLQIGLKPIQGHLVYGANVVSDGIISHVIVDAGTGSILHEGEGKTIEEVQQMMDERKAAHADKKLERIDKKIEKVEARLSESTGNDALDALRADFVDKIYELKDASINGDSDRVQEIRAELKDLKSQIRELRTSS